MLDLVLPLECGGCGAPSTRWCPACARQLAVKADEPHLITPRVDPGVPVLSLGRYTEARREAIVAVKEHGLDQGTSFKCKPVVWILLVPFCLYEIHFVLLANDAPLFGPKYNITDNLLFIKGCD